VFKSDESVTRAGVAIDNFEVNGPPNSVPLPVELVSFTGEAHEDFNLLSWITASEINNMGFEIQRSEDAVTFMKCGFVGGKGNSTSTVDYTFRDNNVDEGVTYYRLKQVDFDGKENYSGVIALSNKSKHPF